MIFLVLLGAPGAGKGTQAALLSERLAIPHVATGDLFRAAVREGSAIGLEARRFMERGQLVPDEITVRMLLERLAEPDARAGVILDGFPRTVAQAEALDAMLKKRKTPLDVVIEIRVDEAELFKRIETRAKDAGAGGVRADDNPETLKKRILVYKEQTAPLIPYYEKTKKLKVVDGMKSIDEVWAAIQAILNAVK